MKKILLLCLFFLLASTTIAQNKKVLDSLNIAYQNARHDTTKVLVLAAIALQYSQTKSDTTPMIGEIALRLGEKISFRRGIGLCLNALGAYHLAKSNYPLSLEYYQKNLKIQVEEKDKKMLGITLNNIVLHYKYQGN